jgi:dihydrodipicolinate reductase
MVTDLSRVIQRVAVAYSENHHRKKRDKRSGMRLEIKNYSLAIIAERKAARSRPTMLETKEIFAAQTVTTTIYLHTIVGKTTHFLGQAWQKMK